jgi:hypothetical protein
MELGSRHVRAARAVRDGVSVSALFVWLADAMPAAA